MITTVFGEEKTYDAVKTKEYALWYRIKSVTYFRDMYRYE
jgi:hypothetical protein